MYVRLLKHWNGYKPGRVFNMPDGAANTLLKRGVAERQSDEPPPPPKPSGKKPRKR